MAVYRIGDMIRMKREALGFTREQLCEISDEICGEQTLYRIESGKVKVKQEIYRKLMECMGELPERSYAAIKVSNYRALNLKTEIQFYLVQKEYEEVEKKLKELEQFVDGEYARNKQYLLEIKSKIAYYKQQISLEEYLDNLWEALRYTIPNLDKIEFESWPYNCEEFEIFIDILNIYHANNEKEKEETLLLQLKRNIEKKYMDEDYYVSRHINCLVGLSQLMCMEQKHEISMEYCREGVEEVKKQRILGMVYNLLYDLSWNKEELIQKKILNKEERVSCKRILVQAYYLSIAQGMEHSTERIKRLCERNYSDKIRLL